MSAHVTSARKPSWWDADPEPIESTSPAPVTVDTPEPEPAYALPPNDPDECAAIIKEGAGVPQADQTRRPPIDFGQFVQSCPSGEVTGKNPPWLYSADPACPPGDVPPDRWRQFLADACAFAGSPLAEQAAALGWTEDDLYGADGEAPFARRDKAGLLRLLNGNRLVEISEDVAVIETQTG